MRNVAGFLPKLDHPMADKAKLATLVQALKAGKIGGADAAEALVNVLGSSVDLALVVESLQAAIPVL